MSQTAVQKVHADAGITFFCLPGVHCTAAMEHGGIQSMACFCNLQIHRL